MTWSVDMSSISKADAEKHLKRYEKMVHYIVGQYNVSRRYFSGVDNEDLLQAGRVGVLQAVACYKEGRKSLDAWVFRLCRQHVSEEVRRATGITREDWADQRYERKLGQLFSSDRDDFRERMDPSYWATVPQPMAGVMAKEQWARVSEHARPIVTMYMQGMTLEEIAKETGLTRQGVYYKLKGARAKWRTRYR